MQLPVLNGANKAMKKEPYTYTVTYKDKEENCSGATMFDINTAIMRCLVKNCAVHGIGICMRGQIYRTKLETSRIFRAKL